MRFINVLLGYAQTRSYDFRYDFLPASDLWSGGYTKSFLVEKPIEMLSRANKKGVIYNVNVLLSFKTGTFPTKESEYLNYETFLYNDVNDFVSWLRGLTSSNFTSQEVYDRYEALDEISIIPLGLYEQNGMFCFRVSFSVLHLQRC
jgi:hypothetical protein